MHVFAVGLPGGLAVQTTLVAVVMAAMTGIIGGEIVLLGLMALPQMLRLRYDPELAIGTICAGGSLGTMIPPSVVLILYGLTASVSIGDLFLAGIMPGLLLGGLYVGYIVLRCSLNPALGPPAPLEERQMPLAEKLALLKGLILPLMIIVWVLGSIYGGIASVTELAGIGACGALASAWLRKRADLGADQEVAAPDHDHGRHPAVARLRRQRPDRHLQHHGRHRLCARPDLGPAARAHRQIIVVMMLILVVLGMFMDWIGILLLTMPIFVPVATDLGFDPVWFGILFCMNMQASYLTPPFGPAAFYLKSVAPPEITMQTIFRGVLPFVGLQLVGLLVVLFFPRIALWPLG